MTSRIHRSTALLAQRPVAQPMRSHSAYPGTRVLAEGPFGSFMDRSRTRHRVALVAAGVGVTPIRALLEEMSGRPGDIAVIYRATTTNDVLFRQEPEHLARQKGAVLYYVLG